MQDIRPDFTQRAVGIDGNLRSSPPFGAAVAGNPFGDAWTGNEWLGDIYLPLRSYQPTMVDMAFPANVPWVVGRSYNGSQSDAGTPRNSNGPQGYNWAQMFQQELVFVDNSSGMKGADDLLVWVTGAGSYLEFKRTANTDDTFRGINGTAGVIQHDIVVSEADTYIYTDPRGYIVEFWGIGDADIADNKEGQIWRILSPETTRGSPDPDHAAYVGNLSNKSTALSTGYDSDGLIQVAYDSANRRYTSSYGSVSGTTRLTGVVCAVDDSGWTTIGSVTYDYYSSLVSGKGSAGDLKSVNVQTRLSDGSQFLSRYWYYRYYTGTMGEKGPAHNIKLVVGPEAMRPFPPAAFESETDDDLKALTDVYITEYESVSSEKIKLVFFSGECSCDGTNGTYTLDDNEAGSLATYVANATYDTGWGSRTMVKQPDETWFTQYFDELGQPLSRIVTDDDPTMSPAKTWVTQVSRNSGGQVTELRSPANNATYTHSTGIFTNETTGLITLIDRVNSGDGAGLPEAMKHRNGTGTAYYDSWTGYELRTRDVDTNLDLVRPVVDARRAYHTETATAATPAAYDETTYDYAYYSSTSSDLLYTVLKQVTTVQPEVSSGNNGEEEEAETTRYTRKDGTIVFTQTDDGVISYTLHENHQVRKRIIDCDTSVTADFSDDDYGPSDWSLSSTGVELRLITEHAYDEEGRLSTTTVFAQSASPRTSMKWYTLLDDERPVTFSIPRIEDLGGGSHRYYGPVRYSVSNNRGQIEEDLLIAVDSTDEDPSDWIAYANPLVPVVRSSPVDSYGGMDGTLARWNSKYYNRVGAKLEKQWIYHDIPGSGTGSVGDNYDETLYTYDGMGRLTRSKDPTGTISRTHFDTLGRASSREIGTNDYGDPYADQDPAITSGPNNMVKTEALEYDGGSDGGNSYLTSRTAFIQDDTTGQRVTIFKQDYRGRTVVAIGEVPPYSVNQYDNHGRVTATGLYSSSSGLDEDDDPVSLDTNRVGLTQTYYDERGQVWKTTRHEVEQDGMNAGDLLDSLDSLVWYDNMGRVAKSDAERLIKIEYSRIGEEARTYILASDNDSVYGDVLTVTGDIVLEEHQTYHDPDTRYALMQVSISRHHDDIGGGQSTGALDTDSDLSFVDMSEINGRVQISTTFYDELSRPVTTAIYGTNGGSDFERDSLSEPVPADSNDTRLVTATVYADDGSVGKTIDPLNRETRFTYDDAGRLILRVDNYVDATPGNDNDIHTRYAYTDGLQTRMWVDLDGLDVPGSAYEDPDTDDQVTDYVYGVAKGASAGDSKIAHGGLLAQVIYPDDEGMAPEADHSVYYAYNAQGQQIWTKDQAGNIIETTYDDAARVSSRYASTVNTGDGFDDTVRSILMVYENRGMVSGVAQLNASVQVLDALAYTYDDWGNLETLAQTYDVQGANVTKTTTYAYEKATTGRNTLRRTSMTYPDGTVATYEYLSAGGLHDAAASRVSRVKYDTGAETTVATYDYLGVGHLVGTDLPEPKARWHMYEDSAYADMDRFNRVVKSRWTSYKPTTGGPVDIYNVALTYDVNSNITLAEDAIHFNPSTSDSLFDAAYTMDGLNRVTRTAEGNWDDMGEVIDNNTRDEAWTLSQTGNWLTQKVDLTGDLDYDDSGEFQILDDSIFTKANEWTSRTWDLDGDNSGDIVTPLTYDKAGNLTEDDWFNAERTYDAFGRLVSIGYATTGNAIVTFAYNGLNQLISRHENVNSPFVTPGTDDPKYFFVLDDQWRRTMTYRAEYDSGWQVDADPKERFLYHAAGLGGRGGSSYIDSVILCELDHNSGWADEADGTLERRDYYLHNWRADVSVILTSAGHLLGWNKYSAYGIPFGILPGDLNSDGEVTTAELAALSSGGYDVRKDPNLDGSRNGSDVAPCAQAAQAADPSATFPPFYRGRFNFVGARGSTNKGYAGYNSEPNVGYVEYECRNRNFLAELGRWDRRDPLGYVDGPNWYGYVTSNPITGVDPQGLLCSQRACLAKFSHDPELYEELHSRSGIIEYEGCSHKQRACLAKFSHDPDIFYELQRLYACAPVDVITIKCITNCDSSQVPPTKDMIIKFCDASEVCNKVTNVDRDTLKHEIIHLRQRCELGVDYLETCDNFICAEVEAYCNQGKVPCPDPALQCSSACYSASGKCGRSAKKQDKCKKRCEEIVSDCVDGGYFPLPSEPLAPIPFWNPGDCGGPAVIAGVS